MSIGSKVPQQFIDGSWFKWPKEGIKYLGIYIPPIIKENMRCKLKIIKNISNDMDRWTALPLSLLGRVESIRMNVLPRLLYLFHMLPLEIPKCTFEKLDRLFSRFIWQGKCPWVRLWTLQLFKKAGGLELPNLRYYFWAEQLKPLTAWLRDLTDTRWLNIEKILCQISIWATLSRFLWH